ncbi:MAG TPA: c-type cytochrome biogenesis protein CcsB [Actinomycetota bacterium]|nr:c-type cytochrome biogenesis protein CcsB [Actinomycetota bacterium]
MSRAAWSGLSTTAFSVALFAYLAAMLGYFHHLAFRRRAVALAAAAVAWAGLAAHAVSVVARGVAAGRVPWGNMYEYSSLLALLTVAGYLGYVELRHGLRQLGGFALMFAVVTMAIAVEFLYVGPAPLVPALDSYWLKVHVVAAIVGSSLFALGAGVATPLYLVQEARERRRGRAPAPIMGAAVEVGDPPDRAAWADEPEVEAPGPRRGVLPPAAVLDRLAYRTIAFAFPIWTFAVISGAIWAQHAWGRYWGWDPKETWSFITWTVFAGYLHARATMGWKGRRAAVLALVGFGSLLVTYYVVNLWIVGLHSYAGV